MLLVVQTSPGVIELTYMWLPTWLGMNADLKKKVEAHNGKLKQDVQAYCVRRGIEVSDLVTRFFQRIVSNEKERRKPKPT